MGVSLQWEQRLWESGRRVVIGIDEVGRGAIAGPVTVGVFAVELCDSWPEGLADSKQVRPAKRNSLYTELESFGLGGAVGHATSSEIDEWGIVMALRLAGVRALQDLSARGILADAIILDGKHNWLTVPEPDLFSGLETLGKTPQESHGFSPAPVTMVVGGDNLCVSVAAASIRASAVSAEAGAGSGAVAGLCARAEDRGASARAAVRLSRRIMGRFPLNDPRKLRPQPPRLK